MMIIKPKDLEMSLTSANTVSDASLVRIYAANAAVITVADSAGANTGSLTVPAGGVVLVEKEPLGTVTSDVSVKAVSVAYKG
jgi:hypothetical protein